MHQNQPPIATSLQAAAASSAANPPFMLRWLMLFCLLSLAAVATAQPGQGGHVEAELVAETRTATPGETLWVALKLDHQPGWHTYWRNPGDAGKPTEIDWQLPAGVSAGDIVWPRPLRFELPADLVDFGYEDEIFLLTALTIDEEFAAERLDIGADARWLECEEICIPGGATVSLSLPVTQTEAAEKDSRWAEGFARTRAEQPREDVELDASFSVVDGRIHLLLQATEPVFAEAREVRFIPGQHRVFDYKAAPAVSYQLSSLQLSQDHHRRVAQQAPERVEGLLIVEERGGAEVAYAVDARPAEADVTALGGALPLPGASGGQGGGLSLPLVFSFAVLGGLILNLMPCVFPVLSLKALSLAGSRDAERNEQRLHGLAYTGGVISAFLALAVVLLALRAGGSAVGWGFHLQSPWFVAALIYLFFLMGLSLSGVVAFGGGIMGLGSGLSEREGYSGSYFTGVLASVVASPCTAPFMGSALGFAFTQSMPVALTVFVALGFGMALPFLLFSFVPALARLLPRPGRWMDTFKQVLAFPLYLTAVWLLWVLGRQAGADAMALVIGGCVLLALAAWLWQQRLTAGRVARIAGALVIVFCLVAVFALLRSPLLQTREAGSMSGGADTLASAADVNFEVYSDARLAELREAGKPVFVNMTASWCITCLVNERVALSSETVHQAFAEQGVTYLKGDWTNNDPAITAVLKQYNTSGVPLYLLYPPDSSVDARVLPQILTEGTILSALEELAL